MLRPGKWRVGLARRSRPSHQGRVMPVVPPLSLERAEPGLPGNKEPAEGAVIALCQLVSAGMWAVREAAPEFPHSRPWVWAGPAGPCLGPVFKSLVSEDPGQ